MNSVRLTLFLAALLSQNAVAQEQSPADAIAAELTKAKEKYQTDVQKALTDLLQAFAVEEQHLRDGGLKVKSDQILFQRVRSEKKAFEANGKLPTLERISKPSRQLLPNAVFQAEFHRQIQRNEVLKLPLDKLVGQGRDYQTKVGVYAVTQDEYSIRGDGHIYFGE